VFGDVYQKLFAEGSGVARVQIEYPEPLDVLNAIHEAGGIAVLAHPHQYHNEALLEELIAAGLDGVEVWHPSHTEEQTEALLQLTEQKGLLATGGSDFHGMYNRTARAVGSTSVPDDRIAALLAYKSK
jgi:predicted metal-dependent phosphoesterase TrpH